MQLKDRVLLKIEKIAFGGEGVGRIDNLVVFVPFSVSGDELEIEITQIKKKFARGKIIKIIKASPLRVKSFCNFYQKCGGCCYQHIKYENQLEIKREQVEEVFFRIGKIDKPPVLPVIPSQAACHYRGKAQCHRIMSSSGPSIGFLDISGSRVVDISHCGIMEESINKKMNRLREEALIHKGKKDARLTIWSDLPGSQDTDKGYIRRIVQNKEFLVPFDGFFQNNLYLTDKLVDEVCRLALTGQLKTVIDIYCGCGLFSIFLAPSANEILGIELSPKAVKFAQINAHNANLKNIKFVCGDAAEELIRNYSMFAGRTDLVILDPPRAGCERTVLSTIAELRPSRIIYVSCNPATLARDVVSFKQSGYRLLCIQPLDMFPQTQHIEVIVLLEYK